MELDYQYIDDFLKGKLSERENQQIEHHLKTHPLDAEMVANVADALQEGRTVDELAKLEGVFRKNMGTQRKVRKPFIWSAAASIVLLLASGLWFVTNNTGSPTDLFGEYYKPYEDMVTTRGVDSPMEAMEYYNKGEFAKAEELYANLVSQNSNKLINVYYALSQFENNRPKEALKTFGEILNDQSASDYYELSHWYSAMIYLSLNDAENAKKQLQLVKGRSSVYTQKAKEILESL